MGGREPLTELALGIRRDDRIDFVVIHHPELGTHLGHGPGRQPCLGQREHHRILLGRVTIHERHIRAHHSEQALSILDGPDVRLVRESFEFKEQRPALFVLFDEPANGVLLIEEAVLPHHSEHSGLFLVVVPGVDEPLQEANEPQQLLTVLAVGAVAASHGAVGPCFEGIVDAVDEAVFFHQGGKGVGHGTAPAIRSP